MPANFFELQRFAETGLASPDMTYHDRLKAVMMFPQSYPSTTVVGVPPLSFKANGKPLASWIISGNSRQNGTPTPDAPIYPEFVGERTENLLTQNYVHSGLNWSNGTVSNTIMANRLTTMDFSDITSGQITAAVYDANSNSYDGVLLEYDSDGNYTGNYQAWHALPYTWTVGSNTKVRICVKRSNGSDIDDNTKIMLNTGSTALPYEPYGYKLPITCGSQTTPIYLGQVQTTRKIKKLVLDGTENWSLQKSGTASAYFSASDVADPAVQMQLVCTHYQAGEVYSSNTDTGILVLANGGLRIREENAASSDRSAFVAFLQQQYAAGNPVIIWYVMTEPETSIVNEPLCKIGDYTDTVASINTGAPSIPTAKGQNTLSVGTTLQPSSMTITT